MSITPCDSDGHPSGRVLDRLQDAATPDVLLDRLAYEFAADGHRQEIFVD